VAQAAEQIGMSAPKLYAHLMPSAEGRARQAIEAAFVEDHTPSTSQEVNSAP